MPTNPEMLRVLAAKLIANENLPPRDANIMHSVGDYGPPQAGVIAQPNPAFGRWATNNFGRKDGEPIIPGSSERTPDFHERYGVNPGQYGQWETDFYPGYEDPTPEGRAAITAYNTQRKQDNYQKSPAAQTKAVQAAMQAFDRVKPAEGHAAFNDLLGKIFR